ncbi:MAG: thiolase family protein [Hyphomicrobiaceae bacterium]|nr:MAG: thiolase family protein [Hyphomicrobiaceae bacterium]
MSGIAIVEARRTPFGKFGGKLSELSAVELGGIAARAVLDKAGVEPDTVEETIFGTAILSASTMVAARQINLMIGLPEHTPSLTIDRACCSSMTCVGLAMMKIQAGLANTVLAGGIESSSRTPFMMKGVRWGRRLGDFTVEDPMQFRNPITNKPLTVVTGEMAMKQGVGREEQDEWAYRSHMKYFEAYDRGVYRDEIVPVEADDDTLDIDESPRRNISLEKMKSLPTVHSGPTVTSGNAPGLNDGASAVLLMAGQEAKRRGVAVMAEILAYSQLAGSLESSVYMPGHAIADALRKANLTLDHVKRIEINEAFAAMPLVSLSALAEGDAAKAEKLKAITNVNGGAVAIGHPPGASGTRVLMALVRELQRTGGGYGAAAICGGFGQADAVVVKV